jgi:hypothetical protein
MELRRQPRTPHAFRETGFFIIYFAFTSLSRWLEKRLAWRK